MSGNPSPHFRHVQSSLFSAVVTAFVIESSRDLKPDYEQINAILTAHMLKGLNNPGNSSYLADLPSPEKLLAFEKPAIAKVVNILWFAALGLSLSGVLIAMLAKQWLVAYGSQPQDEPHKTACQRQRKYDSLNQWSLPWILALLPALLHASSFLFLIGLIAYMWQLDSTISLITCVILGTLFLFYFASGALAAFSTDCPYNTPLSDFIRSIFHLRDDSRFQADIVSKDLSSKAVMWLATTKKPKTVSAALQSLAGLRRGFTGYEADQAQHLAKLAFERLRSCFIPEWRNGDTYSLRTERQYEASCYCRTLMHFIDDTRSDPRMFSAILDEPSLLVFIQLLASCSDPSISLLALCDHQRLLHQIELHRWISVSSPDGGHDLPAAAKMLRSGPSQKNMKNIVKCLNDYLKGSTFLHPYAIEIAVETIGFAPLSWTTAVFTKDPPLSNIVDPLVRLLGATRESIFGVRRSIARTFSILARIYGISRMDDPVDDFALRFDSAMLIVKDVEGGDPADSGVRDMLLTALSQFVVKFEEDDISTIEICEELFYECDRRFGDELPTFSDKAAVTTLLPLLLVGSLKQDKKARVIGSLYNNAVSAAQNDSLPDDSFLHNITPPNPFPPEAVSYLLKTLEGSKDTSYSWLRDVSITLYLITRNSTHRHCFLEEAQVVISLIRSLKLDEVSSHLFWILSESANETITAGTKPELTRKLIDAGMLDVVREYCTKIGLTPSDVHLWSSILPLLATETSVGVKYRLELAEHIYAQFEAQEVDRTVELLELREPLLQFSFQSSSTYTSESASEALRVLGAAFGSSHMVLRPPNKIYSPTNDVPKTESVVEEIDDPLIDFWKLTLTDY